ncbi:hypothetical protein ABKV19_007476 [Rosa sericea]
MELPSSSSSPNPQTVPSSPNWEHDVFLSFRGEDTRNSFTDHLYYAMSQRGIDTFRDTEKLRRGKSISPELLNAIEESKFAVTVLSTNYATSTWCLDELAHILDCRKVRGLEVLPVFYHVEPSEIRKQTGNYGKAFAKHETNFKDNMRKVDKWREALEEIASLSGWHVTQDRGESEVIQEIAKEISICLNNTLSNPDRDLIGMDVRIEKLESYLDLRSDDVLSIGIWGMGGIGKTTLAKEVFKKIRNQFDTSGFVSEVRLHSEGKALVELQKLLCGSFFGDSNINIDTVGRGIRLLKKVLHKKKVLIVLDDVDELKQLKDLAPGKHDEENSWGPGSRLIITTRDRRTLTECDVHKIYEAEKLSDEEASQLICQQAFKKNYPPAEFVELSKSFVKYAGGLPLAHKVKGSQLWGREVDEWSEVLDRLDEDLDKDIFSVLEISFDGLQDTDKKIFLDIACFFNGEDHVRVQKILKSCGFSPQIGITNLIDKSLIKIESKKLWMHELLRCLGWHIVRRESKPFPGKRSRLWLDDNAHKYKGRRPWHFEDARNVLTSNTGTSAVEGLFLSLGEKEEMRLSNDPFLTMTKLRLLKIYNVNFLGGHFTYLSDDLRCLEWHECPLKSLPSGFTPNQLVEFKMPNSCIERLWKKTPSMRMLTLMDLSNCQYLVTTPDFSEVPNLEELILEGCKELSEVHPTIRDLQHLKFLNLKGCASLKSLPPSISLRSLETFILSGCSKLEEFPEIVGNMQTLSELYLDGTAIREVPVSIQLLTGLVLLNLCGCKNLPSLPSALCRSLTSLKFLYMTDSSYNSMRYPPRKGLSTIISCRKPEEDEQLPILLPELHEVSLSLQLPMLPELDEFRLGNLEKLDLSYCQHLKKIPDLNGVPNLKKLILEGCEKLSEVHPTFGSLQHLIFLNMKGCVDLESLPRFICMKYLEICILSGCSKLKEFPEINGDMDKLSQLHLDGTALENLPIPMQHLKCPIVINLRGCKNLLTIPILLSLKALNLSGCSRISRFPNNLGSMAHLEELDASETAITRVPQSISFMEKLKVLSFCGCKGLQLPNRFSQLSFLTSLNLRRCGLAEITVLASLCGLSSLQKLDLSGNKFVSIPSEISRLSSLKQLNLSRNDLVSIPDAIGGLSSLQRLNLSMNDLVSIPDAIDRLSSLQQLDLSTNDLVSIPDAIGGLSSLQRLNLSTNDLVSIPDAIGRLSSLQRLDLSMNDLVSIPDAIGQLSSLQRLDLSMNDLVSIPDAIGGLSSLQRLDLSMNNLVSIPDAIGGLSSLQRLDLSTNDLVSIPDAIGRLSSLQRLNLSMNDLVSIPDAIGGLSSLQRLDLSTNNLVSIPDAIGRLSSLQQLDLSTNDLASIPDAIGRLSSLQRLDLSTNDLGSIPNEVGRLSSLERLDLSNNNLASVPNEISRLCSLKHFGFE